jgi:dTDP-4-amino-4,6-dideoxygalactose transaminase
VKIPFLDLKAAYDELAPQLDAALLRAAHSGWYILGEEVAAFERDYAAWVGADHCVGVGNGLDALTIGLRALGVGAGDEVIVPSNTYIATWLAIDQCRAVPVPVEPDPVTHCLNPERVEAAVTARTKVVLPVHLYGHPADLQALRTICEKHGLRMLEDAAHAHGAALEHQRIGSSPDAVAWSFYPSKNLGALGDAGAVTTNDPRIARDAAIIRNYGSEKKYVNDVRGINSRLDPIHAAVLRVKLSKLQQWNTRRDRIARVYMRELEGLGLGLPSVAPNVTHAWHLFVVTCPRRDELRSELDARGVGTVIHYPVPPFRQAAYKEFSVRAAEWPIADWLSREVLSLPMGPHLSDDGVAAVVESVRQCLRL